MSEISSNFSDLSQATKSELDENGLIFEPPAFAFKIIDFKRDHEDSCDSAKEAKEYYELKPVMIPNIVKKDEIEFHIEEIISEKYVLDYEHEIKLEVEYSLTDYDEYESSNTNFDDFDVGPEYETFETTINSEDTPFQCNVCDEIFYESTELFIHTREYHRPALDECEFFKCSICNNAFNSSQDFSSHMKSHKDVKRPFSCCECGKKFKTFEYLENHRHNKMCNTLQNICAICGKEFKNQFNLIRHRTVHTNERPYKCKICQKTFKQQDNLNVHVRCHKSERLFKCTECPKAFKDQSFLFRHQRCHSRTLPFKCTLCEKPFRAMIHLQKHMRSHQTAKPFKCETCGKRFKQAEILAAHEKIHIGNNTDESLRCSICDKRFTNSCYLNRHLSTHTTEKPYKCSICDLEFKLPEYCKYFLIKFLLHGFNEILVSVTRHLKTHNQAIFKCKECGKHFKEMILLRRHEKLHTDE